MLLMQAGDSLTDVQRERQWLRFGIEVYTVKTLGCFNQFIELSELHTCM